MHLSSRVDQRVGDWAEANNVEIAFTPTSSMLMRALTVESTSHVTKPSGVAWT